MKVNVHLFYIFRRGGLTIIQPHIGWDKILGFSVYLVVFNILLFDVTVKYKKPLCPLE